MKNKKLKLEGEENIKFNIDIDFNIVTITLVVGGIATKYKATINFEDNGEDTDKYLEDIGILCEKLYLEYRLGVKIQNGILKSLEDKYNIEINL